LCLPPGPAELGQGRVTKIEDLIKVIIPHFIKYPLLTQKYGDFFL
jgi:hypothetical protein